MVQSDKTHRRNALKQLERVVELALALLKVNAAVMPREETMSLQL